MMLDMTNGTESNHCSLSSPSTALTKLTEGLDSIRQSQNLSVSAFADRLGISYAEVRAIRCGSRRPGHKTLSAIMRTFPELTLLVLEYLQDGGRPRRHAAEAAVDSGEGALTSRPPRRS